MEKQGQWLLCPYCHGKTRVWIREDTVLHNFLLFCPKCKREELIDLQNDITKNYKEIIAKVNGAIDWAMQNVWRQL